MTGKSLSLPAVLVCLLGVLPSFSYAEDTVSFSADLMPTLKRRCASCHMTGDEPGKLSLVPGRAYAALVEQPSVESALMRVAPGDPEQSYFMHKLNGTHLEVGGSGARMPFHQDPLPQSQIDQWQVWIAQGARQN